MSITEVRHKTSDESWKLAGEAWGHAAADWAFHFETYARDGIEEVFSLVGVTEGIDLFDMACGSGYALSRAERLGANTAGLDASRALLDIAARRAPMSDLRIGTMFDLPFADESFDAVTSFNGVWGGCGEAFVEAYRILRPGAKFGVTFWGPGKNLDLRDWFIALGSSTAAVGEEMIDLAAIGAPGVVEDMYETAGFVDVWRGSTSAILEFADEKIAWQTMRSPGVVLPAIEAVGENTLRPILMAAIEPFRSDDGSYRLVNELTHAIGTKPL